MAKPHTLACGGFRHLSAERPDVPAAVVAAAERYQAAMTVAEPLFDLRDEP